MIAVDSSTAIAYLAGDIGPDIEAMEQAMIREDLRLPPPVLTELLSDSTPHPGLRALVDELPLLPISEGFWQRVGDCRALLHSKGLKARLADAMIAQCCVDLDVPLITRDADFRHFERWCGLKLAS